MRLLISFTMQTLASKSSDNMILMKLKDDSVICLCYLQVSVETYISIWIHSIASNPINHSAIKIVRDLNSWLSMPAKVFPIL